MKECVFFWIIFVHVTSVFSQYTSGDVRLVNGNTTTTGVLEVFIEKHWGTVCSCGFNIGSAAAVCRQLGFLQSTSFGLPSHYNLHPSSQIPILTNVTCPDFDGTDYATSGSLHILRCLYSVAYNSCSIHDIVALSCDNTLITANPYNGQVQLIGNGVKSSGLVEIFLHNQWGTICGQHFNEAAADSVCRQLGYTNAKNFSTIIGYSSKTVWIDSITCDSSQSCFSRSCISHNPTAITSGSCANNRNDVIVNCTFTSTDGETLLAGNEYICRINSLNILIIILPTVLGSAFCVLLCILLFCCICCFTVSTCPLYAHKTKRKYEGLI